MTASLTKPVAPLVILPATALKERDGKTSVWVIDPGKLTVQERGVTVSERGSGTVTVTEGLSKGERVVTAGAYSLASGQAVQVDEAFETETMR